MTPDPKLNLVRIWPDVLAQLDEAARKVGISRETAVNTLIMAALQFDLNDIEDVMRVKS
jgi:hypothetical protein